jgi:hypothetical protein
MCYFVFKWEGSTSLSVELSKPLRGVSVEFEPHGSPMFINLWRTDGTGLKLNSEMHDAAESREVGVLCFSYLSAPEHNGTFADLASAFKLQISVSKLIIHESDTTAESGVILRADDDNELIIVPSAKPYCLAIGGGILASTPHIFEPEYPLDRYERVPLAAGPPFRRN